MNASTALKIAKRVRKQQKLEQIQSTRQREIDLMPITLERVKTVCTHISHAAKDGQMYVRISLCDLFGNNSRDMHDEKQLLIKLLEKKGFFSFVEGHEFIVRWLDQSW